MHTTPQYSSSRPSTSLFTQTYLVILHKRQGELQILNVLQSSKSPPVSCSYQLLVIASNTIHTTTSQEYGYESSEQYACMCGEPIKPLLDLLIQNVSYRGLCFGCASTLVRSILYAQTLCKKKNWNVQSREGALVTSHQRVTRHR